MAESATLTPAEAPDREDAKPEPAPKADAPRSEFARVAEEIEGLKGERRAVGERQRATLESQAKETAPIIAGAQQSIAARGAIPPPPQAPKLAEPPSRQLTDFLAPVQGESPQNAVSKMIHGLGLMAMGLGKGDARAALASLSGAMKGWHEGDKERADRHFADWQANTGKALKQWEVEHKSYRDILEAADLDLESRMRMLQLLKLKHENQAAPDVHDAATLDKFIGWAQQSAQQAVQVEHWKAQLEASALARADSTRYKEERLQIEREKLQAQLKQVNDAVGALSPEALSSLGQQWALGKLPPGIARGKAGMVIMPKIIEAGVTWAKTSGINLQELPAVQAEVDAARKALVKVQGQNAVALANVGNFEKHMDGLVKLSEQVDRSQRPVIARWQLKARGQYEGDAEVARFEAQAFEAAMEFAKVMVGSAQGDAATRDHAREVINSWLNKAQLRAVADQLKINARQRIEAYRETEKAQTDLINTVGGRIAGPAGSPAASPAPKGGAASVNGWSIREIK